MTDLKGKTAIVTGSTSGIGLGIATSLAEAGCNVLLNGFGDVGAIQTLTREMADRHGIRTAYSAADMSKPAEIRQMVAQADAELGGADILVNNAGIQFVAPIDRFPEDKWDAVIAINLSAVFHATKAALPLMRRAGWGRIVNIASAHGLVASAEKSAYVTAKHGVIGLTKVTALETANENITCNAICPGWVLTPLVKAQIEARAGQTGRSIADEEKALLGEKQPMLRFTTPEQLGALAHFLCTDAAATITGASLSADGGWTAQ